VRRTQVPWRQRTRRPEDDVLVLLFYSPVLIFLPILLLGGIVFVVVPGGFIIVLIGACYFASVGLIGLFGLATKRPRHAIHANRQRSAASSARLRPINRTPSKRQAAEAPSTAA
jgi:hypothetical protein